MHSVPVKTIFELLAELQVGLTFVTPAGDILYSNQYAQDIMKRGSEQTSVLDCHDASTQSIVEERLKTITANDGGEWHRVFETNGKFIENYYTTFNVNGQTIISIVNQDVTKREQTLAQLKEALYELEMVFQAAKTLASSLDYEQNLHKLINLIVEITSFNQGVIWIGNEPDSLYPISHQKSKEENIPPLVKRAIRQNTVLHKDYKEQAFPLIALGKIQGVLYLKSNDPIIPNEHRKQILSSIINLTGTAVMNAQILYDTQKRAYEDNLTKVNNRQMMEKVIADLNSKQPAKIGALMIDVNRLKEINDTFGHEMGDQAIAGAADILKQSTRKDNIFRYGGDEFLILIENANRQIVVGVINRINTELQRWNKEHEKFPTELSFSVGWATTSRCKIEDMIRRADQMMYRDKEKFYKDRKREPR